MVAGSLISWIKISAKGFWAGGHSHRHPNGLAGSQEGRAAFRLALKSALALRVSVRSSAGPAGRDDGGGTAPALVKSTATQRCWRRWKKQGCRLWGPKTTLGGFQPKPRPGKMSSQFLFPASETRAHTSLIVEKGFAQLV